MIAGLRPGQKLWSVAVALPSDEEMFRALTGGDSRLMDTLAASDGLAGVHPAAHMGALLALYDSKGHAVAARLQLIAAGVNVGKNVTEFTVAEDGVPELTDPRAKR